MSNLLAFPMYAVDRADTRALWLAVQQRLADRACTLSVSPAGPNRTC